MAEVDVEDANAWICTKVPSFSFGEGKRMRPQDDFIPWKRGVSL
jgi:hypothetical protein